MRNSMDDLRKHKTNSERDGIAVRLATPQAEHQTGDRSTLYSIKKPDLSKDSIPASGTDKILGGPTKLKNRSAIQAEPKRSAPKHVHFKKDIEEESESIVNSSSNRSFEGSTSTSSKESSSISTSSQGSSDASSSETGEEAEKDSTSFDEESSDSNTSTDFSYER